MCDVYQTLDGTFYIIQDGNMWKLDIKTLPGDIPHIVRRIATFGKYSFADNKLFYTDDAGKNESVYKDVARVIHALKEGAYLGEVTVVDNDFLEEWKKL